MQGPGGNQPLPGPSFLACMSLYGTGRTIPESDRVYWTLSALLARRHYGRVTLFADSASAKRLTKDWAIYFDEVDTTTIPRDTANAHPMCWSVGKLAAMRAMALRGKPFFHIDGDAFLFRPLEERLTTARMFAQCVEKSIRRRGAMYRRNTHYPINELLPLLHLPKWMAAFARMASQRVINMGIFGGQDTDAIGEYADIALRTFVNNRRNVQIMRTFHRAKPHFLGLSVIAEQWSLSAYCHAKGITPEAIMDRIDSFNVDRANEVNGYVHLYSCTRKLPQFQEWANRALNDLLCESQLLQKAA